MLPPGKLNSPPQTPQSHKPGPGCSPTTPEAAGAGEGEGEGVHNEEEEETQEEQDKVHLELWVTLFLQLKALACDSRPECRSCAVTTLMTTLTTHGSLLRKDMWDDVLNNILFAIYNHATETSEAASTKENQATVSE